MGSYSGRGGGSCPPCGRGTAYGGWSCWTSQFDFAEWETLTLRLLLDDKFSINIAKTCKVTCWTADEVSLSLHAALYSADVFLAVFLATAFTGDLSDVAFWIHDLTDVVDMGFWVGVRS